MMFSYVEGNALYQNLLMFVEAFFVSTTAHCWVGELNMIVFPIAHGANFITPRCLIKHN